MGRARGSTNGAAAAGFDAVLGARRRSGLSDEAAGRERERLARDALLSSAYPLAHELTGELVRLSRMFPQSDQPGDLAGDILTVWLACEDGASVQIVNGLRTAGPSMNSRSIDVPLTAGPGALAAALQGALNGEPCELPARDDERALRIAPHPDGGVNIEARKGAWQPTRTHLRAAVVTVLVAHLRSVPSPAQG